MTTSPTAPILNKHTTQVAERFHAFSLFLALTVIVLGLLAIFVPLSNNDNDGSFDSRVTDGFVLSPSPYAVIRSFSSLARFPAVYLPISSPVTTQLVPPPISIK